MAGNKVIDDRRSLSAADVIEIGVRIGVPPRSSSPMADEMNVTGLGLHCSAGGAQVVHPRRVKTPCEQHVARVGPRL